MAVEVRWYDDEQRIVYYEFSRGWNWQHVSDAMNTAQKLAVSVDHEVDCIVNVSASGMFMPKGVFAFARRFFDAEPIDNMNTTVIVGTQFFKTINDTAQKLSGKNVQWHMHFVETLDDALAYLGHSVENKA